jgi:hypothetical protein
MIAAMLLRGILASAFVVAALGQQAAQLSAPAPSSALTTQRSPTRADFLRGDCGRYRANNDLLFYRLDIRVDPDKKSMAGKNTIRFT